MPGGRIVQPTPDNADRVQVRFGSPPQVNVAKPGQEDRLLGQQGRADQSQQPKRTESDGRRRSARLVSGM